MTPEELYSLSRGLTVVALVTALTGCAIVISLCSIAHCLAKISGSLRGILHFTHIIAEACKYDEEDRDHG